MAVSPISNHTIVYYDNITGTADAYGRLLSDFDISDKRVVGLLSRTNGQCCIQLRLSSNKLGIKIVESTALNPVAQGTTVSVNVYYVYA